MIATTSLPTDDYRELVRERQFELDPPATNTFIPSATVSFIQQTGRVEIRWVEGDSQSLTTSAGGKVLEQILSSARRDVEKYPASARAHSNLGLALTNRGELQDAAKEFEAALNLDSGQYVAAVNLARVRVAQGRYDEAEALYLKIREANPRDTASLMSLAHIAMRRGNLDQASSKLKEVLRLDEKSALARYHLAVVFLAVGKPNDAITQLRKAATSEVRSASVHQALAVAYTMSGDFRRAIRSFRTALNLDPTMPEAVHGLSNVLLRQGDLENTTQVLLSYLEKRPDDAIAREILASAYKAQKRYSASRAQLLKVLQTIASEKQETKLREANLMNNIAVSYALEGELEQGERWIKKAISAEPKFDPVFHENLARFHLQSDRLRDAEAVLMDCQSRFPGRHETRYLLSACFEKQGRYDEAIQQLEASIRRGNAPAKTYAYLGGMLADDTRDLTAALATLEEGHRFFPEDPIMINNLAYVYLLRGETAVARSLLASIPSGTPQSVYLVCTIGLLNLWEGNIKDGAAYYLEAERIASLEGKSQLARTVRQKMHLELARAYKRGGELQIALTEAEKGLRGKGGRLPYREDLESLLTELRRGIEPSNRSVN
jgi:Flp pilus assembly protein TadD